MGTTEKIAAFVDGLPKDCIEVRTEEQIRFHLPRKSYPCPHCGSTHTIVNSYGAVKMYGLNSSVEYIYRRRRMLCQDCKRTFSEDAPFLPMWQRTPLNRLRQVRARANFSQEDVMRAIGVSKFLYTQFEAIKDPVIPTLPIAIKIANFLHTTVEDIWGDMEGGG